MTTGSTTEPPAGRRNWVPLLYFFLAALIGLGFVVVGTSMALLGAKDALFPSLGLPRYSYGVSEFEAYPAPAPVGADSAPPVKKSAEEVAREQRIAKAQAVDERRAMGLDQMLSGLVIAAVGAPVLVWHLRRGRALSAGVESPASDAVTP
jgi:hypothetical protein